MGLLCFLQLCLLVVLIFFLEICEHIIRGHVLPLVSCLLVALRLVALKKQVKGIRLIAIGEVIYQLVAYTLAIQFKNTFAEYFSPHEFG